MRLADTKLRKTYWHPARYQMVQLITCDPIDGASLIVEPLDECGDIMGGDLFRTEASGLEEATQEKWERKYPSSDPNMLRFEQMTEDNPSATFRK